MSNPTTQCACGRTLAPREIQRRNTRCSVCRAGRFAAKEMVNAEGIQHPPSLDDHLKNDREQRQAAVDSKDWKTKYEHALKTISDLEASVAALGIIREQVAPIAIEPRYGTGTSEGTVIAMASDWHIEEIVDPKVVNGLNRYNPDIAQAAALQFFQGALRLTQIVQQDLKVDHMILGLLGDFITNDIHGQENAETNAMPPMEAIVFAQRLLVSGIEFLLQHSSLVLTIPCHSGNHARTTQKTHHAGERGHSLEYLMYHFLASHFAKEPRVRFNIADGYHLYTEVYDTVIRTHHGHRVKYMGGVGGLYIPVGKKIDRWNQGKWADLDIFGHYHQQRDGGTFLSNGSMIGYNAYAQQEIGTFEPPRQQFTVIDKKRGRTCVWPILFDERT